MSKASSVPKHKTYSEDSNEKLNQSKLPKITKNTLSKLSKNDNRDINRGNDKKYPILNKDVSNAINNINNNLNTRLKARNEVTQDQINDIQNNYYEIKYLLNNKINKLEKNQKKVFDYLKFSVEQDKFKNGGNDVRYHNYIQNYSNKNTTYRENALNVIREVPNMIQNKMNQIYLEEVEENRKQNRFLNDLRNQLISEFKEQRKQDNIKYKQQIDELRRLKEDEEKERLELLDRMREQKMYKSKKHISRHNNNFYNPIPYNYPQYPNFPNFPINNIGGSSLSSSLDELIKVYLLKDIMNNPRYQPDYHRHTRYDSGYYRRPYRYTRGSHYSRYNSQESIYNHDKYKPRTMKRYNSNLENEFEIIPTKYSYQDNKYNNYNYMHSLYLISFNNFTR